MWSNKESARWSPLTSMFLRMPTWVAFIGNSKRNTVCYARNMEGHTKATTSMTATVLPKTTLQSKRTGAQPGSSPKTRHGMVQILHRSFDWRLQKHSVPWPRSCVGTGNIRQMLQTVSMTRATVLEVAGWIALRNYIHVGKLNYVTLLKVTLTQVQVKLFHELKLNKITNIISVSKRMKNQRLVTKTTNTN